MKLSRTERWILVNQYRILAALYPNERDAFEKARTVLAEGFELEYQWIVEAVYADKDVTPSETSAEVLDIFEMYEALQRAAAEAKNGEAKNVVFPGFDGNYETRHFGYAHHVRKDRFVSVAVLSPELNSHMRLLPKYRAMLAEWNKSANRGDLTREDVTRILDAKPNHEQ